MMPDIYGGNKLYKVIKYNDLQATQADAWYYADLFKATNLGITTGDLSDDGTLNFAPQRELTRAELITMLIRSVDVDVSSYESLSEEKAEALYSEIFRPGIQSQWRSILGLPEADTMSKAEYIRYLQTDYMSDADIAWAKTYMNFAYTNDLIGTQQYLGLDYLANGWGAGEEPSQVGLNTGGCNVKVRRDDTAWILCAMYVRNILSVQVPIKIYKYSLDTSCEKNSYWKTDRAFTDINRSYPYCIDEIYQMYMNGIMVGDTEGKFNPGKILTRAEACTAIVRSLFDLDEQLENAKLAFEGQDNYIDLSAVTTQTISERDDVSGSRTFSFVAPRTGYYYISDIIGGKITVSDVQHREIKGLDAYTSAAQTANGARYNIRKGEMAYIHITDEASSYSFTISAPEEGEVLSFAPDRTGTFIYDNCPEYLLMEDTADAGNTALITARDVTGKVTMAASHLLRKAIDTFGKEDGNLYFDYLITNEGDQPVTITVDAMGIQTINDLESGENNESYKKIYGLTYGAHASYMAWADYLGKSLMDPSQFSGIKNLTGLLSMEEEEIMLTDNGREDYAYKAYTAGESNWYRNVCMPIMYNGDGSKRMVTVNPDERAWLFGANRPHCAMDDNGYPYFLIMDCTVTGAATIQSLAFHDETQVLNSANQLVEELNDGKIYTKQSNRNYMSEAIDGSSEIDEIGDKYKGIAGAKNVVYTESEWTISGNEGVEFYTPKVYNSLNKNGQHIVFAGGDNKYIFNDKTTSYSLFGEGGDSGCTYWLTHLNSASTQYAPGNAANSDMLGFVFEGTKVAPPGEFDQQVTYFFDDLHKSTQKNNAVVTQAELDQFRMSPGTQNPPSMRMANFSIREHYTIEITNNSNEAKTITYMTGGKMGLFYNYSVRREDGEVIQKNDGNLRCELPWGITENGVQRSAFYEMFSFPIQAGETLILEYTNALPNIGTMGLYNVLYAH